MPDELGEVARFECSHRGSNYVFMVINLAETIRLVFGLIIPISLRSDDGLRVFRVQKVQVHSDSKHHDWLKRLHGI